MNVLLCLLIVANSADVPIDVRYPEATRVFRCTFDESWDEDFDDWPDQWKRRRGPGFPHYVKIAIDREQPSPTGGGCLRIDIDGGAAAAYGPPVKVSPLFGYVLEGYLSTEGLKYDQAYFSITLLDQQRHRLETFCSEKIRQSHGWKKLRLGPISSESDQARLAIIGLHVEPRSREDLQGTVFFDDVWLGRLPRMALKSNDPYNFFTTAEAIEIHCTASGSLEKGPRVTFELEDVLGKRLARVQRRLAVRAADTGAEFWLDGFSEEPVGRVGETRWKPPVSGPGFYRVRATMKGRRSLVHRRELDLVVVDPRHSPAGGEFGWTLPRGNKPLPLPRLHQLLGQAGINWLKYPLWYEEQGNEEFIERLMAFGERLSGQGIELVGLLHDPPKSLRTRYGQSQPLSAANLFAPAPKVWYPSLEPVMARLASRVRWWQLGDDKDASFVGYPNLSGKIAQVKNELDRIGQDVNLAIGWSWNSELPEAAGGELPWRSVALSAEPPMTYRELATYLDASTETRLHRWVVVEPLPADVYSIEVRAIDLVRRMIAAKIHGADAVFCPEPFSTDHGLMNDDGTPGELFLPWRTTALLLGGAKHLGSITLPGRSPNQVFSRGNDAVMLVWNDKPTEEVIYLGEEVRQMDLWGRSVTPAKREHRQVIEVGRLPTFVTGLNEPITRWRMDFALARKRIPSVSGRPHRNSFSIKNHFPQGVAGQAELVTPEVWIVSPQRTNFRLAGGEQLQHPFEMTLLYNASSGRHKLRADFEVQSDRLHKFSVYRELEVGLGDVYIDVAIQMNREGELEVHQRFVNDTGARVSFRCQLFVPGRRRLRSQIIGLGRARDVQIYHLPRGKELLGSTLWLRAEEMDGPRVLNYRFLAKP